ncbi:hypothetical protein DJ93_5429 [Bacillus clarus]|uniref:Uncharacterized protein n=1 Tax=Bacillus clarus TaxID=2338372 RepID=A0A090YCY6_9BACI|nr:hypothetical protein DJ93_5429 [Bacillus clarus]
MFKKFVLGAVSTWILVSYWEKHNKREWIKCKRV